MSGTPEDADADLAGLADHLHSLAIHVLRALRGTDAESGLSGPRLSALSVVVYRGPVSMGELAEAEQVRPPTMTRLVQALEGDALVRREPVPTDARRVRVRATSKGRLLLEEGRRRRVEALAERLARLPPPARTEVARAVTVLEGLFGGPSRFRPENRSG